MTVYEYKTGVNNINGDDDYDDDKLKGSQFYPSLWKRMTSNKTVNKDESPIHNEFRELTWWRYRW